MLHSYAYTNNTSYANNNINNNNTRPHLKILMINAIRV